MKSTKAKHNGKADRAAGRIGRAPGGKVASGPVDRFIALSDEEKEAVFRELDRPIPPSETRPMTSAERAGWDRAKRKPGRPKIGKGTEIASVTVEQGLLERVDAYAKEKGLSRARLVAIALESFLDDVRRYRATAASGEARVATRRVSSVAKQRV